MARITAALSEVLFTSVLMISTLPQLISVPATLIAGKLAGNVIKYKTQLIYGMLLFLVGGIAPYFKTDFGMIIAFRIVCGLDLGMVMLLGMAAITLFNGEERAKMIGNGTFIQNVGGILFTIFSGFYFMEFLFSSSCVGDSNTNIYSASSRIRKSS